MRKTIGKLIRCMGLTLCALIIAFNGSEPMRRLRELPARISAAEFSELSSELGSLLTLSGPGESEVLSSMSETLAEVEAGRAVIKLFGAVPIKEVTYGEKSDIRVMPGGISIGVSIYTNGALVVGLGGVNEAGDCPAASAGIKAGDVIVAVNGAEVENAAQLEALCSAGGAMVFTVRRGNASSEHTVTPLLDASGEAYRAGMWVRDSSSGIGTMSFYNMEHGRFGALGHPITDVDTGSIIDVKNGEVIRSSIMGVTLGENGAPGEMIGSFSALSDRIGSIDTNGELGLYGDMYHELVNPLYPEGVMLAYPEEVHAGKAELLCSVDDGGVKAYDCEVVKAFRQDSPEDKSLVIRVTDPELIKKTGGIVQGMSGSPVIQDGKLIAAVTHVFVNDPLSGYCIYAMWMNEAALSA